MAEDVDMLDATPRTLPHQLLGSPDSNIILAPSVAVTSPPASANSTDASRRSSLAALMNPEPVSEHELSDHDESEVEAEIQGAAEDDDNDEGEEDDESSADDEDDDDEDSEAEEEGDDSTKDSILIVEGPSTSSTIVPEDTSTSNPTAMRASSASRSISIPILVHASNHNSASPAVVPGDPASFPPSVSAPPGPITGSSKPASSAKPRSKHVKARSPSPSPPPPPPPPPLETVRLQINLGGPDNYEVDVSRLAKDTGQRPPTPPPRVIVNKHPLSESEGETDTGKKKKRKKKNPTSDYYDVNDPFIDDSELAIDERTYFAQTKQQGFYVSSGEVALLKDKTPKKPKSKKMISLATALNASTSNGSTSAVKRDREDGTSENPVHVDDDSISAVNKSLEDEGDERAGQKRKRYLTVVENGKKRKIVDQNSFHPELQASIEKLKEAIKLETWSQKGKFPPNIKPLLAQLALQAIKLDEYDEYFFNLMPVLFPYNKFTMSKLIKRTVFSDHTKLLQDRQDELLKELKTHADEGFQKAEEEWTKSVIAWDKRQEKKSENPNESISAAPTRHPTEEMEVDGGSVGPQGQDGEGKDNGISTVGGKDKGDHPPHKRYRMTEQMKNIVWQLVLLSNECCRLENEKNALEGSVIQVSEQGLRKALYQKIVAAFPDGWMSSGQISRDVSAMKKRYEKEAMENEA